MCVFSADKHQGDAGHHHGVCGTHRSRRDAIQQHQNVIRKEVIQERDRSAYLRANKRGRRHRVAT